MSRKDKVHDAARIALENDGWKITHDPYTVVLPERYLFIDLRAEKDGEQVILVEIKGFEQKSQVEALAAAAGKYMMYRTALRAASIEGVLYLAIPVSAFEGIIGETLGEELVNEYDVRIVVFDPEKKVIVRWLT
jgi:Holliday junction resolvase-like predicted endonuclease